MVQGKLLIATIATIAREQAVALWLWSHKGAIVRNCRPHHGGAATILKLVYLFAAGASVAVCLALPSGARAVATDQVTLTVYARSIDGTLLFSDATGWSWRCGSSGYVKCTVPTERGRTITVTAVRGTQSSWWAWDAGGPCASSGSTCTLQVNTDMSATATFSARLYLTSFGPGSITRKKYPDDGTPLLRRVCSAPTAGDYCADYAYGERIRLRARPADSDARRAGWGGACRGKPYDSTCTLTMTAARVASATFVYPPSPSDCPPNASCDPITVTWPFYVRIYGAGAVLAPKVGNVSAKTCDAFTAAGFMCSNFEGPKKSLTVLKAFPVHGGKFLGWSGPCHGTRVCKFRTKSTPITVYAKFG
jgi:Divergent InlB B-repeat domain